MHRTRHRRGRSGIGGTGSELALAAAKRGPPVRSRPLISGERRLIASTDGERLSAKISGGFRERRKKRSAWRETIGTSKAPGEGDGFVGGGAKDGSNVC